MSDDQQIEDMLNLISHNEESVLTGMSILSEMTNDLAALEAIIYSSTVQYPVEFYKAVRKISEGNGTIFQIFRSYESTNEDFLEKKNDLLVEQINQVHQLRQKDVESQLLPESSLKDQPYDRKSIPKLSFSQESNKVDELTNQICTLTSQLKQNDKDFQFQIRKYKAKIFQMNEQLDQRGRQIAFMRQYQSLIESLEIEIVRLKEQKYRDSMIIENMTKKIRYYEKERGGIQAFLSPRSSIGSRGYGSQLLSPQTHGIQRGFYKNRY